MSSVEFKDGVADEIDIRVIVMNLPDVTGVMYDGSGATVHQGGDPRLCDSQYCSFVKKTGEKLSWAVVTMGPCISAENRAKALAIHTACLSKIGGCNNGEEILPRVFAQ
jgi:hypothetical protein